MSFVGVLHPNIYLPTFEYLNMLDDDDYSQPKCFLQVRPRKQSIAVSSCTRTGRGGCTLCSSLDCRTESFLLKGGEESLV